MKNLQSCLATDAARWDIEIKKIKEGIVIFLFYIDVDIRLSINIPWVYVTTLALFKIPMTGVLNLFYILFYFCYKWMPLIQLIWKGGKTIEEIKLAMIYTFQGWHINLDKRLLKVTCAISILLCVGNIMCDNRLKEQLYSYVNKALWCVGNFNITK